MTWLFYELLPWWTVPALGVAALIGLFVLLRAFGIPLSQALSVVGAAAVAVLTASVYRRGQQAGYDARKAMQNREDEKAVRERDAIEDAIAGRTPDENRKRLKKWAR